MILSLALAACASHPVNHTRSEYNPSRYYPPPGSHDDPWGPYVHEASSRFGVPELWIRQVMRQESAGQEDVISWAGAMGLMQVMPDTYDGLKNRYALGDDPFDPHNNILAGTAYLREMYDRYGAPGFLAAYNAGPNRLDHYLIEGAPLPEETVNYVASIAPFLGSKTAMSGPLAIYASRLAPTARAAPGTCDPDPAYDSDHPCSPLWIATKHPVAASSFAAGMGCDPDAAYDPLRPCPVAAADHAVRELGAAPPVTTTGCDSDGAYDPARPCAPASPGAAIPQPPPPTASYAADNPPFASAANFTATSLPGRWAIQVGAFASLTAAQAAAENARSALPDLLHAAKTELPATTPFGTQVAFRARLSGLSAMTAIDACGRLKLRGVNCMTVPPEAVASRSAS